MNRSRSTLTPLQVVGSGAEVTTGEEASTGASPSPDDSTGKSSISSEPASSFKLRPSSPAPSMSSSRRSGSKYGQSRRALRRVLSQGASSRPLEVTDLKWLWAAYRKGGLPHLPEDLGQDDFRQWTLDEIAKWDGAFLLEVPYETGRRAVGVLFCRAKGRVLEPHTVWFPWVTGRQKLETLTQFINEMRRDWCILVWCLPHIASFFDRIAKYGILRRVGLVEGWADGGDAILFASRPLETPCSSSGSIRRRRGQGSQARSAPPLIP